MLTRRRVGFLGLAALVGSGVFAARWFNVTAEASGKGVLSAPDALAAVQAGDIVLVDIRRPDEWARTGIPAGAVAIDMRRRDFGAALLAALDGQRDAPVALICARGVRSRGVSAALREAGLTQVIDVPEGMMGSGAGPGWIKRGLPVVAWSE